MRSPDPVEIVAVAVPVLIEVVAVVLFIAAGLVWMVIVSQQVPV